MGHRNSFGQVSGRHGGGQLREECLTRPYAGYAAAWAHEHQADQPLGDGPYPGAGYPRFSRDRKGAEQLHPYGRSVAARLAGRGRHEGIMPPLRRRWRAIRVAVVDISSIGSTGDAGGAGTKPGPAGWQWSSCGSFPSAPRRMIGVSA